MIQRLALKELFRSSRFTFLFILNFTIGLSGFVTLDTFKQSVNNALQSRSKTVLGADLGISSRGIIKEKDLNRVRDSINTPFAESSILETYSMVANKNGDSRLVQLKALGKDFPFYGEILIKGKKGTLTPLKLESASKNIYVYPEILLQLNSKLGDMIKIGSAHFKLAGTVEDDASMGISTSMAPRAYLSIEQLKKTQLLREGSLIWRSHLFKLNNINHNDLEKLRLKIFNQLTDPGIRVFTHITSSQQTGRLLGYLNDFLGLTTLAALFLSCLGGGFLFRNFIRSKFKTIATYLSLGFTSKQVLQIYLLQVLALGFLASSLSLLLSTLVVYSLSNFTQQYLNINLDIIFSIHSVLLVYAIGLLGSFCFCLPFFSTLKHISPNTLFQSDTLPTDKKTSKTSWLYILPGLFLFLGLAIYASNSYEIGSLFVALFLSSGLVIAFFARSLWKLLGVFKFSSLSLSWALRDIQRFYAPFTLAFISLGLGGMLINLIPQLQTSLQTEIEQPNSSKIPSVFLFDIQEEQVNSLKKLLKENKIELSQISPMIRARLTKVNNSEFKKGDAGSEQFSREQQNEMRFRNRGYNLSYRDKLSESETIIKGEPIHVPFKENSNDVPKISIEKRFAQRLGIKIGDLLEFDIQGVSVIGKIVNIRKVKWTSFQPNFFILFQPGVLDIAPKTYIATIPKLDLETKNKLQKQLVKQLPNVSQIDVSRLIVQLQSIITQMSFALKAMAWLCILAGAMILFSIANHQVYMRRWEVGLLKSLGAPFKIILASFYVQFLIVSVLAFGVGSLISLALSWILSQFLFDSVWNYNISSLVFSNIISFFITLVTTYIALNRFLKTKPQDLLSN